MVIRSTVFMFGFLLVCGAYAAQPAEEQHEAMCNLFESISRESELQEATKFPFIEKFLNCIRQWHPKDIVGIVASKSFVGMPGLFGIRKNKVIINGIEHDGIPIDKIPDYLDAMFKAHQQSTHLAVAIHKNSALLDELNAALLSKTPIDPASFSRPVRDFLLAHANINTMQIKHDPQNSGVFFMKSAGIELHCTSTEYNVKVHVPNYSVVHTQAILGRESLVAAQAWRDRSLFFYYLSQRLQKEPDAWDGFTQRLQVLQEQVRVSLGNEDEGSALLARIRE